MFMDVIFALLPLALILVPITALIILYLVLAPSLQNEQVSGGTVNYDKLMQDYLFKSELSREELLCRLEHLPVSAKDKIRCSLDRDTMTLTFSHRGVSIPYTLTVQEREDGCTVRLHKNVPTGPKSNIPFYINGFMIEKIGAELLPYS